MKIIDIRKKKSDLEKKKKTLENIRNFIKIIKKSSLLGSFVIPAYMSLGSYHYLKKHPINDYYIYPVLKNITQDNEETYIHLDSSKLPIGMFQTNSVYIENQKDKFLKDTELYIVYKSPYIMQNNQYTRTVLAYTFKNAGENSIKEALKNPKTLGEIYTEVESYTETIDSLEEVNKEIYEFTVVDYEKSIVVEKEVLENEEELRNTSYYIYFSGVLACLILRTMAISKMDKDIIQLKLKK